MMRSKCAGELDLYIIYRMKPSKECKKCWNIFFKRNTCSKKNRVTSLYCSHSCANSVNMLWTKRCVWRTSPNKWNIWKRGKDNKQYTRVDKYCKICNKEFTVKKYREKTAKYCCKKCSEIDRNEGKSPIANKIRKSIEWKLWKDSVLSRDWYMCQKCNIIGTEIHSHHIKNFSQYPELRFAIDNWITLCKICHKLFHKIYWIKNNTKKQIDSFLSQEA